MERALIYVAPQRAEIQPVEPATAQTGEAVVHTFWSGVSRGTERLVFHGRVPPSEAERMRAPFQTGAFPYPVKYGYAAVGQVEDGPQDIVGEHVFVLYPHQTRFAAPLDMLVRVPRETPLRRAILAANMETALNAAWDGGVGPGDRIAIVGAGVLGGLLAGLCAELAGAEILLVDIAPERAQLASDMNVSFATPDQIDDPAAFQADVVFHTSVSESGLALALALAGFEATVVELSWYGDRAPAAPLGAAFHSQRLALRSSQVGHVAPARRARWSARRRLGKALELLADARYDAVITDEVAFDDLPTALPRILADPTSDAPPAGLATAVRYGGAT